VCGIEQFVTAQPTHRAVILISPYDALAELALM
jgi:hypothetical protein